MRCLGYIGSKDIGMHFNDSNKKLILILIRKWVSECACIRVCMCVCVGVRVCVCVRVWVCEHLWLTIQTKPSQSENKTFVGEKGFFCSKIAFLRRLLLLLLLLELLLIEEVGASLSLFYYQLWVSEGLGFELDSKDQVKFSLLAIELANPVNSFSVHS